MEFLSDFIHWFLHIDTQLKQVVSDYHTWTYAILFLIVFCETGLVVTPFLPGDSLLFAAGAIASAPDQTALNVNVMALLLLAAAILGDAVNYAVGRRMGKAVFDKKDSRIFKPQYLERTHKFFEKYGNKTIVIARFVPIVRTFAPFLAGVGTMSYRKFAAYNVTGAVLWVGIMTYAGYFFGQTAYVQRNFKLVILAIIVISIMPAVIEVIRARRELRAEGSPAQ